MKDNFSTCLEETLRWEGGYTNHPLDPGGPTNLGIIQSEYNKYTGTTKSVKEITKEEAINIYHKNYWNACGCDDLPTGLDLCVFDFAVNSGSSRALKLLEQTKDINTYMNKREKFLRGLKTFNTFGRGWMNRTKGIREKAISMSIGVPNTSVKQMLVKNSSKLSVFQGVRRVYAFFAAAIGSIFTLDSFNMFTSMATQLKTFMTDHAVFLVLASIGITWLVLKWGEMKHILDFKEGRYVPSGMIQGSAGKEEDDVTESA